MAVWSPQPGPQADAIAATWCRELLFGGARGGGKSDFLLGDFLQDVPTYGRLWRGIIFRKTYPELEELIGRSHELFPATGATWKEAKTTWRWPNGAFLRFRHLERDLDVNRYQGHQYTWIGWDEVSNWKSDDPYRKLLACLRPGAGRVPTLRVRATGNPGGPGHQWVKSRFVDYQPLGYQPRFDEAAEHDVMFIPSRVQDNLILLQNDPSYIKRLKAVGSETLVRAWLEGDWSAVMGAYFDRFSLRHVVAPHTIPAHWTKFRCFDWGFARPFACYWLAVSDGQPVADGVVYPKGAIVVYREYYGCEEPNKGLRLTPDLVGKEIARRSVGERIDYSIADPSIWAADRGPSIYEQLRKEGVNFRPGDNNRLPGWLQIQQRLGGDDDGSPMLFFFSTCVHLIRTLPALQHDSIRAEDVDTDGEDHAADALRYGLMSRPYSRDKPTDKEKPRGIEQATLDELYELDEQYERSRRFG